MLVVNCQGPPYEVGVQHGEAATKQIAGSIAFYSWLFKKYTGRSWASILPIAKDFGVTIRQKWPWYYQELEGIATGAGRNILDIIALNVRTEIAFGLLTDSDAPSRNDGCTTVSLQTGEHAWLGQNWDWMEEQKENLVLLTIACPGTPTIKMVTEGGIIGKIGLNECGVGVCLNAIRSRGLNDTKLPVHLALRMALEASSARKARSALEEIGLAGSAHILVADATDHFGLEFTSKTCVQLDASADGYILHTNHMLEKHDDIDELAEADSFARMDRISLLTAQASLPEQGLKGFATLFDDHDGFPVSICRAQEGVSEDATVFNIVMDLKSIQAVVSLGKPCHVQEQHILRFGTT